MASNRNTKVALITGASRGLGLEIARLLARRGYRLAITARGADALADAARELSAETEVLALAGDVADPTHAADLVQATLARFGRVDALVNNASTVGPSPMPALADYPPDTLVEVFRTNVVAPLHLAQLVLPSMRMAGAGAIVNVTSDAAVQAYAGWGGYGASKAALEHLSRILIAEIEGIGVRVYFVDPGDMNTLMHAQAEPGVDLSDLPGPAVPAPALVALLEDETAASGRYQARALLAAPR